MEVVAVKKIKGNSYRQPKNYLSWLDFWNSKKYEYGYCTNLECENKSEIGVHVHEKGNYTPDSWYITTLCKTCSENKNTFEVLDTFLIPATKDD